MYNSVTFCQNTKVEITTHFGYTNKFIFHNVIQTRFCLHFTVFHFCKLFILLSIIMKLIFVTNDKQCMFSGIVNHSQNYVLYIKQQCQTCFLNSYRESNKTGSGVFVMLIIHVPLSPCSEQVISYDHYMWRSGGNNCTNCSFI